MLEERRGPKGIDFVDDGAVELLTRELRRAIRRRGIDPGTADDLVQEAWLRTLRTPPPTRDPDRLGGWLSVVVRRLVAELRRSHGHRRIREHAVARSERVDERDERPADAGVERIHQMVHALPEPYRTVVSLHFFDDRSVAEIAAELRRPAVTVRSQLARGLERLRARIRPEHERRAERRPFFGWTLVSALHKALPLAWLRSPASRVQRRVAAAGCATAVLGLLWVTGDETAASALAAPVVAAPAATERVAAAELEVARVPLDEAASPPAPVVPEPRVAFLPPRAVDGVVHAPDGTPVPGAMVWLGARTGAGVAVATSDARGRYHVADVDPRRFLWASHADWAPTLRAYVAALAPARGHDLRLSASRGALEVRVLAPDGTPAPGILVALNDELGAHRSVTTSTGALELPVHYAQAGTTDVRGRVELAKPDRDFVTLDLRRGERLILRRDLDLTREHQSLELVLPEPPEVRGLVLDPDGRPAPLAEVIVRQFDEAVYFTLVADERGRFRATDLALGHCLVSARVADGVASNSVHVTLEPGDRESVRVETSPRTTLYGRVLDGERPLAGAHVTMYRDGARGVPLEDYVRSDAQGRFAFVCNEEITYRLELQLDGDPFPCAHVGGLRSGAAAVLRPQPELRALQRLALEFLGENGSQLPTLVELRRGPPRIELEVPVDPLTRTVEVDLPPGNYELVAWVPGVGTWRMPRGIVPGAGVQRIVVPRPGTVEIALDLPPGSAPPLEAWLQLGGFNPFGFETLGSNTSLREFALDPTRRFLTTDVFPGRYGYSVRPAGFMAQQGTLRVREGALTRLRLAPPPGVSIELRCEFPRGLLSGETLELQTSGAGGESAFSPAGLYRTSDGGALVVTIPSDTTRIAVRTSLGLAGELAVSCEGLSPRLPRPRWTIALEER